MKVIITEAGERITENAILGYAITTMSLSDCVHIVFHVVGQDDDTVGVVVSYNEGFLDKDVNLTREQAERVTRRLISQVDGYLTGESGFVFNLTSALEYQIKRELDREPEVKQ